MDDADIILRILTSNDPEGAITISDQLGECEGGYVCECANCRREVAQLVKRGVRPEPDPLPRRNAR